MKRYENFNSMFNENQTAEEQAAGMIIAKVAEEYNLDIDAVDEYVKLFRSYVSWLNEEAEK